MGLGIRGSLGLSRCLMLASSAVMLLLGSAHLLMTFFSHEFSPRDTAPRLSSQISMWNAWVGFNASHSSPLLGITLASLLYAGAFFAARF